MSLIAIGAAARDPAVIDEVMYVLSEILEKQKFFLPDGSFRNEPGSYGGSIKRYPPQHSGKLNLIMADDGSSQLIDAQIGYYRQWNGEQTQANSQDILVVRKNAVSHAFVDTLEPIADDEETYVEDVVVVEKGNHNQQLVKVTTVEGQDWVYLSGKWGARPDGDQPVPSVTTDADIVVWRVINNVVRRVYIAGGSYANTPNGSWNFASSGKHYVADANSDGIWDHQQDN